MYEKNKNKYIPILARYMNTNIYKFIKMLAGWNV